ncbi:MAG: hypothetical protein J6X57_08440 [Bacteroidales bacterium]|nr:hypothetical protein [Bacteroidales bacterium]
MKRLSILLFLLCACSSGLNDDRDYPAVDEPTRIEFRGAKNPESTGDASMSEFHYLTYDFNLGSWSGELGGTAVRSGNAGPFLPADASRMYWPEGKIYSFYAAGYNDALQVGAEDVEFGTAMMLYSSGTTAVLNIKNPHHNVDWMAAKVLHLEKVDGIPLQFKHVCARVSELSFNLEAYKAWIEEKELDIADIVLLSCTLSDVDEQTYVYASDNASLFKRESSDYTSSPSHQIDGSRRLNLTAGGSSAAISYFAFPGRHTITVHIQTVDSNGNQVVDDRVLSGEVNLPMNSDCALSIVINPNARDLEVGVITSAAGWEDGGTGRVPLRLSSRGSESLDLCAFREDGSLYAHARQNGDTVSASLASGEPLTWWLIANAPEALLEDVVSLEQFRASKVSLEDNSRDSMVMTGYNRGILESDSEKTIQMDRVLSKVCIGKLTPVFLGDEEFANVETRLERVFLLNAATTVFLDGTPSDAEIRNSGRLDTNLSEALSDLLVCTPSLRLDGAGSIQLDKDLYCCPNPAGNTKLVLELTIAGETDYYPITLPRMECNREYRVEEVELLGWGSLSPDVPVDRRALSFSILVNPWGNEDKSLTLD